MNKWIVGALSIVAGAQVCVGAERQLRVRITDEYSSLEHKTPHSTNTKFFPRLKAVDQMQAQFAKDAIPGAEHMEMSAQEPVKPRVALTTEPDTSTWSVVKKMDDLLESEAKAKLLQEELERRHTIHLARAQSKS